MKQTKRFLSILLLVVLVFALLPVTAFAEDERASYEVTNENCTYTSYEALTGAGEVWVANTRVDDLAEMTYFVGDGNGGITKEGAGSDNYNVAYDPGTSTLTLMNAELSKTSFERRASQYKQDISNSGVIVSGKELTIVVCGENSVVNLTPTPASSGQQEGTRGYHGAGIYAINCALTIRGMNENIAENVLYLKGGVGSKDWTNSCGLELNRYGNAGGALNIENVTISAEGANSKYFSAGLDILNGSINITNSNIYCTGGEVKDFAASIRPEWCSSYGFYSDSPETLTIDSTFLSATAKEAPWSIGMRVRSDMIARNNSDIECGTAAATHESAYGLRCNGTITVDKTYISSHAGYSPVYSAGAIISKLIVNSGYMSLTAEGSSEEGFSAGADIYVDNLDTEDYEYLNIKYLAPDGTEHEWTADCEAVYTEDGKTSALKNGYNSFVISPALTISGRVVWNDNDNAGDIRPGNLNIAVSQNGEIIDNITCGPGEDGNWFFEGSSPVSVYKCLVDADTLYTDPDAWEKAEYAVEPESLDLYNTTVEGSAYEAGGFVINEGINKGFVKIDDAWYLYSENGVRLKGFQKVGSGWYYLDPANDGKMVTGWKKVGANTYYFRGGDSGRMLTGWQKIDGSWYYFKPGDSGKMLTGFQKIDGSWYYLDPANGGKMATGWKKIGSNTYYFRDGNSGKMLTGFQKIDGSWYYFKPGDSGRMLTGWQKVGSGWYYLDPANNGKMATGWKKIGSNTYYFRDGDSGRMLTGWQQISGKWYYFMPGDSGKMVTGTQVIDGRSYVFDSYGVWIR